MKPSYLSKFTFELRFVYHFFINYLDCPIFEDEHTRGFDIAADFLLHVLVLNSLQQLRHNPPNEYFVNFFLGSAGYKVGDCLLVKHLDRRQRITRSLSLLDRIHIKLEFAWAVG